uniref:Uncharacterized protein n=1 Tax=Anguilla anguilla TaxID=7936 RepID=A0A0E9VDZ1_ANGAN
MSLDPWYFTASISGLNSFRVGYPRTPWSEQNLVSFVQSTLTTYAGVPPCC